MMRKIERFIIPLTMLLVCLVAALAALALTKIQKDERVACLIQQRALPADHAIAGAWADLETVFAQYSLSRSSLARAKRELPPSVYAGEVRLITDFTRRISTYRKLTASQPHSRTCAF